MPKVLRILNRMAVGGPVLNATYLSKYLSPEFETLLVVGARESHEKSAGFIAQQLGVDVVTIPEMQRAVSPVNDYYAFQSIRKLIKDFQPDIVHTHASKPGVLGRLAASVQGVPAIVHTFHGHTFNSYFNNVTSNFYINTERFLARKSSAIVAISEAQKKELVHDFKIAPEEKFRMIQLGLDLDKFSKGQDEKRRQFRSEFGIADDEIAIGIIGRLVPVKNHSLFLKAIANLLSNSTKKIKAFIVGDGETRAALEAQALQLNISFSTEKDTAHPHPLVFTSWRSDVDVINAGLDIITLTSLNEGTPVSLIEAQAANKPIVSTRVGGIGDIVKEGITALLSDINDHKGFCQHLLNLVQDDSLRAELGSNGSYYVTHRFSYQRLVKDMSNLYYELLSEKITANAVLRKEKATQSVDLSWIGTDMHSHLIPGIDDGSPDMATSLQLIRGLKAVGYRKLITTPHVFWELYPNTTEIITHGLSNLKKAVQEEGIEIELQAAAEYYMDDYFEDQLKNKQPLLTISGNMVLVEFSMITAPLDLQQILFEMQIQNYQPVIAHPERYIYLTNRKSFFDELKEAGCFFQLNLLSLTGHYGKSVQELAEYLYKKNYYDLAGTDLHNERHLATLQKLASSPLYTRIKELHLFRNSTL